MKLTWEQIVLSNKGGFYLIITEESEIDISIEKSLHEYDPNNILRILRGVRCQTLPGLFQEFAAALQFPYYFGNNWFALFDCITSLNYPPVKINSYTIVITNFDKVPVEGFHEPASGIRNELLNLLKQTVKNWGKVNEFRPATPLHIVLHCEAKNEAICREILSEANVEYIELDGK